MSDPSSSQYDDDWLPEDFKPMSFPQLVWHKLKSAPLVGVGAVATVYSFAMASYYMRMGNSQKFNVWLRWRVASQAATIGAAVYYGGVALTPEKQKEYATKQLVLLGELPTNTPIVKAPDGPTWWPWSDAAKKASEAAAYREAVLDSQHASSSANAEATYAATTDENAKYYPLPLNERMEAAQFAARLRAAERAHESEERARREDPLGSATGAEMLAKRMEKAYANRPEGAQDKKIKVANKNKIRKDALAAEARGETVEPVMEDSADR